ncbi:hypothetical protein BN1221_03931 [Brenneria goodwinii]|uniref:Uncharacterized protein n=1 Tax=Brenneria goodwinii TaxID=1109412 RepID=A0A0G4K0D0_9GAMM|nr:hypothetical protein BN1221_03931 [Brenneria goodwinii]
MAIFLRRAILDRLPYGLSLVRRQKTSPDNFRWISQRFLL